MIVVLVCAVVAIGGCVERKLTVTSNPTGAKVYLDDRELGYTPVTVRFDYYGSRTFVLKKDGYRIAEEVREVKAPPYEYPVVDVFSDLAPWPISDEHTFHFDLEPIGKVSEDDLLERANEMRTKVTGQLETGN